MRPDEIAAQAEIERSQGRDKLVRKGVTAGAGLALAGGAARILPFLSEHIPLDLAIKGISKINPKIGNLLNEGTKMGLNVSEGLDYLKSQFSQAEEPAKKRNPLQDFETNYPELAQGLMNTIQNGQTPQAAAAILKQSTSLGKQVKKLEKEVGKNFIDYVLELFGPQGEGMQPQQQPQPISQGQQNAPQQGGSIDQDIMAALDKILKM